MNLLLQLALAIFEIEYTFLEYILENWWRIIIESENLVVIVTSFMKCSKDEFVSIFNGKTLFEDT